MQKRASRTGSIGRTLATAALWVFALNGPAWGGAQGPGLGTTPPPTDAELSTWWMSDPSEPVPKFVCVNAPAIECFELSLQPGATGSDPSTLVSPDCPVGAGGGACRPDEIPGTSVTATLDVDALPAAQWVRTDVSANYPYDGCEFGGLHATTIVTPPTPSGYDKVGDLGIGDAVYFNIDALTVSSLPADLQCSEWIRTSSNDSGSTGTSHMAIQLGRTEYVYVLYDASASVVPPWLQANYFQTGQTVGMSLLGSPRTFDVWRSDELHPQGTTVTLGGNHDGGANAVLMYHVLARPPSASEFCGSWAATITIDTPAGPVETQSVFEEGCGVSDESGISIVDPPLIPGGIGFNTGGTFDCDGFLAQGDKLEYPRTFGQTGLLDRTAIIDAARDADPDLCEPNLSGLCTLRPAMSMVGLDGVLEGGTQVGRDPELCTFQIRFTRPGTTRVVIDGPSANDIDTDPDTFVSVASGAGGIISDIDVRVDTTNQFSDNLDIFLVKDLIDSTLDQRLNCDTSGSTHDVLWDDEAAAGYQGSCGSVIGTFQPADPLDAFDGETVEGIYSLQFLDGVQPGDGTDLTSWTLRISTDLSACSDNIDNDLDGKIDFDGGPLPGLKDVHCSSFEDNSEGPGKKACGLGASLAPLAVLALLRARKRFGRAG